MGKKSKVLLTILVLAVIVAGAYFAWAKMQELDVMEERIELPINVVETSVTVVNPNDQ